MMKIYRYPIDLNDVADYKPIVIQMPKDADVLTVLAHKGKLSLWALVDPGKELEDRSFFFSVTGAELDDSKHHKYISTILLSDGEFVLHVFEELDLDHKI